VALQIKTRYCPHDLLKPLFVAFTNLFSNRRDYVHDSIGPDNLKQVSGCAGSQHVFHDPYSLFKKKPFSPLIFVLDQALKMRNTLRYRRSHLLNIVAKRFGMAHSHFIVR
jgi:hypothetical protein